MRNINLFTSIIITETSMGYTGRYILVGDN